jgi:hypothetical protein
MNTRQVAPSLDVNMKVDYKEEFELVLMRWRYLLKSPNPPSEVFKEYSKTLNSVSKRMWYSFKYAFSVAGYDYNDVRALADVYLVAYYGIFSLRNNPDELKRFKETYKRKNKVETDPTDEEVTKKDHNNFVSFLTQRLEEAGKICSQKNRNIRGTDGYREAFIGDAEVQVSDEVLRSHPETFGYRKLKKKELDAYSAILGAKARGTFRTPDDKVVRVVEMGPKALREEDLQEVYSPDSAFTMNPLRFMEAIEEEQADLELRNRFEALEADERTQLLKSFIASNKNNPKLAEEIKAAKKMVREIG